MDKSNFISTYNKLVNASKEISNLNSALNLLLWDQEVYMPKNGDTSRAEQTSTLSSLIHEKKTAQYFENLLSELIDIKSGTYKYNDFDVIQKANIREWRKNYIEDTKLPKEFVKKLSKTTSESLSKWNEARKQNSFALFEPYLKKIVELSREQAEIIGYKNHPYDALLSIYEPNMTVNDIDPIFEDLKKGIINILKKIKNKTQINSDFLNLKCITKTQMSLSKKIMDLMGLEKDFCRIDESTHPFSLSLHNNDVRMTTRFDENNFTSNILTTLHEGGHSLYQHQLPEEHFGTPVAEPISFGIHESQSRLWETLIGKSFSFNKFFYQIIKKEIPSHFDKIEINKYYKAINKVTPSFIRVEADEVTYSLHIIIRYEIEKALIAGEIDISEIPSIWNEKMKKYLDITPTSDNLGCLQDIHWSLGYFGYFPTYALGNIYASCFFKKFKVDNPVYQEKIEQGQFSFINNWLKENIHKFGKLYSATELIKKITKEDFSSIPYLTYLYEKYSGIYDF